MISFELPFKLLANFKDAKLLWLTLASYIVLVVATRAGVRAAYKGQLTKRVRTILEGLANRDLPSR